MNTRNNRGKFNYDLFLSFSSKDKAIAEKVFQELKRRNLKVFYSSNTLEKRVGTFFGAEIEKALEQSKDFLLVCTSKAMKSEWVKHEYRTFFEEMYIKNPEDRRILILEAKGFNEKLLLPGMKSFQRAGSLELLCMLFDESNPDETSSANFNTSRQKTKRATGRRLINGYRSTYKNRLISGLGTIIVLSLVLVAVNIDSCHPKHQEEEGKRYYIVSGNFIFYGNARAHFLSLKKKGYQKAIIRKRKGGTYDVYFCSFTDKQTAEKKLEELRILEKNNELWIKYN